MALSRREIAKDVLQQGAEATFTTAGRISTILFGAAREVTTELGALGTELFEIGEARRAAQRDAAADRVSGAATHPPGVV